MAQYKEQEIIEKVLAIEELTKQNMSKDEQLGNINYYEEIKFQAGNNYMIGENEIYIARIENTAENTNTYEIYSGKTNTLIATVNEHGKLNFMPEYIENWREKNPKLAEALVAENREFELPKELEENDRVFTREERERILEEKSKEAKDGNASTQEEGKDEQKDEQEEEQQQSEKSPEEEETEQIAKRKGIPAHSVLMVRENSNLYKDHPNLEPNLYFYKDNDGVIRAEYLDSNGVARPSRYFEPSTTSLRQQTVSLGDDGDPVTKEVPYQVMQTKNLNGVDKDIRAIRMHINIDTYGYLEIQEARQGKNGEWLAHDVEVKGRSYNSREVNATTSIRTRAADPDRETEAYDKTEDTGLERDGIEYGEMYLIQHPDEVIEHFIKEGYQRAEAVQILDYMIGEEALSAEEAKERVNEEISNREKQEVKESENVRGDGEEEERTQGGDAWARRIKGM